MIARGPVFDTGITPGTGRSEDESITTGILDG